MLLRLCCGSSLPCTVSNGAERVPRLQADTQIYNKVLSLIEDWSDAIGLPAYRQEFGMLKVRTITLALSAFPLLSMGHGPA